MLFHIGDLSKYNENGQSSHLDGQSLQTEKDLRESFG